LEDRRNVGDSSCNFGDGMDQMVQFLMFMMMVKYKIDKSCSELLVAMLSV